MSATSTHAPAPAPDLDPQPSKRERNKADKRRRIIEAAAQLFREKGFEETTTAEISAVAGIGTGTLYLYVNSKEDLLVDVFLDNMDGIWDEALELGAQNEDLADEIVTAFWHVADYHMKDPVLSRAYFREMTFTTGDVRKRASQVRSRLSEQMVARLELAQTEGRLAVGVDLEVLTSNIFASWHFAMQRRLGRDAGQTDNGQIRHDIERSIRTALFGLS